MAGDPETKMISIVLVYLSVRATDTSRASGPSAHRGRAQRRGRRGLGRAWQTPRGPGRGEACLPSSSREPLPSNYVSYTATLDFCPFFLPWSLLTRTPLNAPDPSFRPPVKVQSDSGTPRGCRSKVLLSPPWLRLSPRTPRRCAEPRAVPESRGPPEGCHMRSCQTREAPA